MKKTQKKLLGFAGLLIVTAMTVFAAFLPNPGAVATNSGVTDTIVVRVTAPTIKVNIDGPKDGQKLLVPEQEITYSYDNAETVTITLEYTDLNGNKITKTLETLTPGGQSGSGNIPINLYEEYGYGDFVVTIVGTSADGVEAEDAIKFSFYPIEGEAKQDQKTGEVTVDLDYDETNEDIEYIELKVYDKDGNLIPELSPTKVPRPQKTVDLPFSKYDLPSGIYTIEITAIGIDGTRSKPSHITTLDYQKPPVVPVPNTGGTLANLNISQTDYLITGLIIFFLIGIFGVIFIAKNRENKRRR